MQLLLFSSIETVSESVIGDVNQLHFLLENLIDEALSVPVAGKIRLTCAVEDDFVRFSFYRYAAGENKGRVESTVLPESGMYDGR